MGGEQIIDSARKTVWIAGASSGLGLATAQAFYNAGYCVIAGARSFQNVEENPNFIKLYLDVCDEQSCQSFKNTALSYCDHVDVFIYCAGTIIFGPCELLSASEYARVMETNFFGLTRLTSQILPKMREQRSGKIILFSSINGVVATPFQSPYVASKHAIEGYFKCLCMETKDYNLQISIVRPGDHKSGSKAYRKQCAANVDKSVYKENYTKGTNKILYDEDHGSEPLLFGKKILQLSEKKNTPRIIIISKGFERFSITLFKLLPNRLFHWILGKYYLG